MLPQNLKIADVVKRLDPTNKELYSAVMMYPLPICGGADFIQLAGASPVIANKIQRHLDCHGRDFPFNRTMPAVETLKGRKQRKPIDTAAAPPPKQASNDFAGRDKFSRRRIDLRQYIVHRDGINAEHQASSQQFDFAIIVDHRERVSKSHASFSEWIQSTSGIACVDAQLPSGDFMFMDRRRNALFPAIVERKTLSDLAGSVISPRFTQQKRLLKAIDFPCTFLILEGNLRVGSTDTSTLNTDEVKRIHSSTITTCFVDGANVIHTQSRKETLEALIAIGKFLCTMKWQEGKSAELQDMLTLSADMKNVIELKSIFPAILSNIYGLSLDSASLISKQYGSVSNLHHNVLAARRNPINELQLVRTLQKCKKRPRDGAELALRITKLFGDADYST